MSGRHSLGLCIATACALTACDYVFDFDKHPPPPPPLKWTYVASGAGHSCAIQEDGAMWCWGKNTNGQLGDNTNLSATRPVRVDADHLWRMVSASLDATCAITVEGELYCWGDNDVGQLGQGNNGNSSLRALR